MKKKAKDVCVFLHTRLRNVLLAATALFCVLLSLRDSLSPRGRVYYGILLAVCRLLLLLLVLLLYIRSTN